MANELSSADKKLKRLRDCWRCGEAQDYDEQPERCPNCEALNPCGAPPAKSDPPNIGYGHGGEKVYI